MSILNQLKEGLKHEEMTRKTEDRAEWRNVNESGNLPRHRRLSSVHYIILVARRCMGERQELMTPSQLRFGTCNVNGNDIF